MYSKKKPLSTLNRNDVNDEDYYTVEERDPSTGARESITRYSDGSSRRNCGGPAGHANYDKYGEEC